MAFLAARNALLNEVRTKDDPWSILKEKEQRWLLDDLFRSAEKEAPSSKSKAYNVSRMVERAKHAIIGDGLDHAHLLKYASDYGRARILVTVLNAGICAGSTSWSKFMSKLVKPDPEFRDGMLPFHPDYIMEFLDNTDKDAFLEVQPELKNTFDKDRTDLRTIIQDKGLIQSYSLDDQGEEQLFCPEHKPMEIVTGEEHLVRRLFIEACKSRIMAQPNTGRIHQIEQVRQVTANKSMVDNYFTGVRRRAKLLLLLVLNSTAATSKTWENFSNACLHDSESLLDDKLPLEEAAMKQVSDTHPEQTNIDHKHLMEDQGIFCGIKLSTSTMSDATGLQRYCRLPLTEKRKIGEGNYGKVFAVRILKGYFPDYDDKVELAMKQVALNLDFEDEEWKTAEWLFKQDLQHESIMKAYASLRTPGNFFIFFPRASCNLRQYMKNENSSDSFENRKRLLKPIVSIAEALEYLHNRLQDESGLVWRCYHRDLKADNILVIDRKGGPRLQITDFGISSVTKQKTSSERPKSLDTRQMFRSPRSLQNKNASDLPDNCPNIAPEAYRNHPITDKADVWAYATVLLEFLPWLHGGTHSLVEYEKQRNDGMNLWAFTTGAQHLSLKRKIVDWYEELVLRTSGEEQHQLYKDSWRILKAKMLVIAPNDRADMKQVCQYLKRVLVQGKPIAGIGYDDAPHPPGQHSRPETQPTSRQQLPSSQTLQTAVGMPQIQPHREPATVSDLVSAIRQNSSHAFHEALNNASVETITSSLFERKTSLVWAFDMKRDDMARKLMKKCYPLTMPSKVCIQCMNWAITNDMPRSAKFCLSKRPEIVDNRSSSADSFGMTPMLRAIQDGRLQIVKDLLSCKANLHITDNAKCSAFHYAVRRESTDITEALLDSCNGKDQLRNDLLALQNDDGENVLHRCCLVSTRSSLEHAKAVLRVPHDAQRLIHAKDAAGYTPLYYLTSSPRNPERMKMAELLKDAVPTTSSALIWGKYRKEYRQVFQ